MTTEYRAKASPTVIGNAAILLDSALAAGMKHVEEHTIGMFSKSEIVWALRMAGVTTATDKPRRDALIAQLRARVAWLQAPESGAPIGPDGFVPVLVGDGFGGHVSHTCAREGMSGRCWGRCDWFETRDLIRGRVALVLCEGHRGAVYRPAPECAVTIAETLAVADE